MAKRHPTRALSLLCLLALLLGSMMAAQARTPLSVGLLYFQADPTTNSIQLEWQTATELNTAGFIIKRSINGGPFISLPQIGVPGFIDGDGNPAGLVLAEGGPAEGQTYQETDASVQTGNTYSYHLLEIENDFTEISLEIKTVVFGLIATSTPTAVPGTTNTAVPSTATTVASTATSTAASTTASTATVAAAATTQAATTATATSQTTANNPLPTATTTLATQPPSAVTTAVSPNQPQPTASNSSTASNPPASNVLLAQAAETETPPTPGLEPTSVQGYPPPTQSVPILEIPSLEQPAQEPYPAATLTPISQQQEQAATPIVPVIGSHMNSQGSTPTVASSASTISSQDVQFGRAYLWLGFLLSLLVFTATVFGTILLFTRKRTHYKKG